MQHKTDLFTVDSTLTLQNAQERGYRYVGDILYDGSTLSKDIAELVTDYGHKLGQPSARNDFKHFAGIYAPIDDKQK